MKTREQYAVMAERLANQANHYTYGDGADPVAGGALATEALVYATLAAAAPMSENTELTALRRAVAELLHDQDVSQPGQAFQALARFREGLPGTEHGEPVLALASELMAATETAGA